MHHWSFIELDDKLDHGCDGTTPIPTGQLPVLAIQPVMQALTVALKLAFTFTPAVAAHHLYPRTVR
jgi:hypothetical protein